MVGVEHEATNFTSELAEMVGSSGHVMADLCVIDIDVEVVTVLEL